MPSLACCYTDDETPFCSNRRFESLPMCKKHNTEVMRACILDALMPWDVMREIVNLAADRIRMHEIVDRFDRKRAETERLAGRAEEVAARRRLLGVVYYVRLSDDRIKIGRTIDLKARMSAMRIRPRDVLAAEPGGVGLEADRHAQFAGLRHGRLEDFDAEPALMEHIECIRQMWGDPWQVAS